MPELGYSLSSEEFSASDPYALRGERKRIRRASSDSMSKKCCRNSRLDLGERLESNLN
jgi:hypothetical protein